METHSASQRASPRTLMFWPVAGVGLLAACAALLVLSLSFVHGEGHAQRPIVLVMGILLASGAFYFVFALRALRDPPPLRLVILVSLAARMLLIPSTPIQEDDIYRYVWDGRVSAAGLDPYRFSPEEIERFEASGNSPAPDDVVTLERVLALKRGASTIGDVFKNINNRAHATVYPAATQAVFCLHATLVPAAWAPRAQVISMKALLSIFDLGIIAGLVLLLRGLGKPSGLCVLYAWCPLVLKELSSSGHMDSIPTFFLVAALVAMVRGPGLLCGAGLGAAISSKFFAVLVLPIAFRALGWRRGLAALLGCAAAIVPALLAYPESRARRAEALKSFTLGWEMNDAVFPWIERAWRLVTEDSYRFALGSVALMLCALVILFAARTTPATPPEQVIWRMFLVFAAALLLGPLGFPWYFVWCVPLLPFARSRSWLLLPGLLSLYYLRFWLIYRFPGPVGGFASGATLFDEVVAPIELGAFYAAMMIEVVVRGRARQQDIDDPLRMAS